MPSACARQSAGCGQGSPRPLELAAQQGCSRNIALALRGSRGFRPGPSPPIDSDCGARLPLCKGARLLLRTARDEADRPGALWRARGARTRADHRIARRRGCAPQWRSAAAATLASAADELLRRCARSGAPPEPAPLARAWRPRTCRVAPNHSTPRRRSVSWRQLDAPRPAHERL